MLDFTPQDLVVSSYNTLAALNTREGMDKLSALSDTYLRTFLREASVFWQIQPPNTIDASILDRATDVDTLVKIEELEPDSTAFTGNFRGRAPFQYIRQDRYAVPFFKVMSNRYRKEEIEFMASRSPLSKIIEENTMLDMQERIDETGWAMYRAAVEASSMKVNDPNSTQLSTQFLVQMAKRMVAERRRLSVFALSEVLWMDILAWGSEEAGSQWVSLKTEKGVDSDRLLKWRCVTTIKNNIIKANEVFGFTEPRFLGHSYLLENSKFWINKNGSLIEMEAYMYLGFGVGNQYSIVYGNLSKVDPTTGLPS